MLAQFDAKHGVFVPLEPVELPDGARIECEWIESAASPRDLRDRVDRVDPPSTAGEDLVDDVGDEAAQEALPGPGGQDFVAWLHELDKASLRATPDRQTASPVRRSAGAGRG